MEQVGKLLWNKNLQNKWPKRNKRDQIYTSNWEWA